jgi:hypothetical protein
MDSPVSALSYLHRAKELLALADSERDKAKLIYSALELRCGVEARLKEHGAVAVGVTKSQLDRYEIPKLAKTIETAFGLGDKLLLVFLELADGRGARFTYAPVGSQLQDIAKKLGEYLHAVEQEKATSPDFWTKLREMLGEGCVLLELACTSEVLRPTPEHGLHFCLRPDDQRLPIVKDYMQGTKGAFRFVTIEPAGRMTVYPAPNAQAGVPESD